MKLWLTTEFVVTKPYLVNFIFFGQDHDVILSLDLFPWKFNGGRGVYILLLEVSRIN